MTTIHDYRLDSYSIDFIEKKIEMNISLKQSRKKIIFSHFFCNYFQEEKPCSILADIEVVPIEKFFIENKKLLEEEKKYAWPIMYNEPNDLVEKILEMDLKYFWLNSSYGMNGWILAKEVSIITV